MMKRLVMLLVIALLSVGVICAVSAENAKLYTTGNVLAAGNYNNSATSSDLTLIIKLTAGDKVLVDEGATVSYILPDTNIDGWTTKDFNDSAWKVGISGVGYADNDDNTTITGPVPSIYTRYHFDAPNASSVKEVTFLIDYDDFYILWLNGVEVARYDPIKDIAPGGVPGFDEVTKKGVTDHESSDTAAGKPNAARWDKPQGAAAGQIAKHVVAVDLGAVVSAVNAKAKLATTWGDIKAVR